MSAAKIRALTQKIRAGDMRALAEAISIFEDSHPLKTRLLKNLMARNRRGARGFSIGVTGSAGSGKSTLIAALTKAIRKDKKKVAVIAVDPTSPKSGGAFLGDRVRMQDLADDPGVFIRSMASRGAQGGVARATQDAVWLCLTAGYDFVFVETVGAGQLDYKITEIADLTLLVLTPEAGDEMQFMKAGLRELVDAFVINKADRPGAQTMEDFLKRIQVGEKLQKPVFKTVAEQSKEINPLYQFILRLSQKGVGARFPRLKGAG